MSGFQPQVAGGGGGLVFRGFWGGGGGAWYLPAERWGAIFFLGRLRLMGHKGVGSGEIRGLFFKVFAKNGGGGIFFFVVIF